MNEMTKETSLKGVGWTNESTTITKVCGLCGCSIDEIGCDYDCGSDGISLEDRGPGTVVTRKYKVTYELIEETVNS